MCHLRDLIFSKFLNAFYDILYVQNIQFFPIFPFFLSEPACRLIVFSGEGLQDFRRRVLTYAKPKWMCFFSDKKVRLGGCDPKLIIFYHKKSHPFRFCIGQHPSLEILQPLSGKNYQPAGRFFEEK